MGAIPTQERARGFIIFIELLPPTTATLVSQHQYRGGYPQKEDQGFDAQLDERESFPVTREWVAAMMTVEAMDCHCEREH